VVLVNHRVHRPKLSITRLDDAQKWLEQAVALQRDDADAKRGAEVL
jgi:hypothetical protein